MMKMILSVAVLTVVVSAATTLVVGGASKGSLEKALLENPEAVFKVIQENPKRFMEVVQAAAQKARPPQPDPGQELEEAFKNPKSPVVSEDRVLGNKEAQITLVEYTDFECPFCSRGNQTVENLKQQHGDKLRVVRKHLPLPMHPNAPALASYYELIARQDLKKAHAWGDLVFKNQREVGGNKELMDTYAKQVKVDMARLKKDQKNEKVQEEIKARIDADMKEAQSLGFSGTPGYLVNGIGVKGAYPVDYFNQIIQRLSNGK